MDSKDSSMAMTELIFDEVIIALSIKKMLMIVESARMRNRRALLEKVMFKCFPSVIHYVIRDHVVKIKKMIVKKMTMKKIPIDHPLVDILLNNILFNRQHQARIARGVLEKMSTITKNRKPEDFDRFQTEYVNFVVRLDPKLPPFPRFPRN